MARELPGPGSGSPGGPEQELGGAGLSAGSGRPEAPPRPQPGRPPSAGNPASLRRLRSGIGAQGALGVHKVCHEN